jgi:hypothetical protein
MGNGRGKGSGRHSRRVDCTTYLMMGNKNIIFVHNFRKVVFSRFPTIPKQKFQFITGSISLMMSIVE